MIDSTQIENTEMVAFTAVLVFKLLSHKVLLINKKYNMLKTVRETIKK